MARRAFGERRAAARWRTAAAMSGAASEVFYSFVTLLAMVNPVEAAESLPASEAQ